MSRVGLKALQSILLASLISLLAGCALLSSGTGAPTGGSASPTPTPTPAPSPTPNPSPSPLPTPTPTPTPAPSPTPTPSPTPSNGDLTKINHIVFMLQENRSFDTVLGHLNDYRATLALPPDVDDYPSNASNPADSGANITPFHMTSMCLENTSAGWPTSHINFNRFDLSSNVPTMDGFVVEGAAAAKGEGGLDTVGGRVMGFYTSDDLISHYFLAATFATSDRWFAPAPVETEPNRMYMVASTSVGHAHKPTSQVTAQTIFDLLNANGITWNIYIVDNTIDSELGFFAGFESKFPSHFLPISQYLTDVQNGTLAQVSYIDPGFEKGEDEHPGKGTSIQVGAAFSTSLITALMNSPSWKDSVFILSFDEGGGIYDHVASMVDGQPIQEMLGPSINRQPAGPGIYPGDASNQQVPNPDGIPPMDLITTPPADPPGDFTRTGFRVPLMVVSPFSKKNYVSHTPADYTAILKMIETRFKLPSLTKRDVLQIDMSEFFDTTNVPFATPPQVPKQPTNGPCTDTPPSF